MTGTTENAALDPQRIIAELRRKLDEARAELAARNNAYSERIAYQAAANDVLKVMSASPGDPQPVFDLIVERARDLCGGYGSTVYQFDGTLIHWRAATGVSDDPSVRQAVQAMYPMKPTREWPAGRAIIDRQVIHIKDFEADPWLTPAMRGLTVKSSVLVPLMRGDLPIGVVALGSRELGGFTDAQIELLKTFADQAVIAIENARLFDEVQARTRDLTESLQQQTATADVLKVISRSSVDLDTVLDTLTETVTRLCRADQAYVFRRQDDVYQMVAARGLSAEAKEFIRANPPAADRSSMTGRVVSERRAVHIPDVLDDPGYTYREAQRIAGFRTGLGIPLLREETLIGILTVSRTRVEPFTDKEIELATTFADQAVIAIENARLFDELRDRQAELRVTFDNMGDGVVMFGADTRLVAWNRNFQEILDLPDDYLAQRPSYSEYFRYLAERGEYSADLEAELSRTLDDTTRELRFERTRPDGRVIEVRRNPVPGGGFVLIYADITERKQAEKAIRDARDAAETALRELQMAQGRLIQTEKLASLGQLTAGIAHEIKNPLNFVNNFSALSAELVDEMTDVFQNPALDEANRRKELDDIRELLKSNLEKVVQHGKRADSIVKNMLLHSREGKGERRSVDINALVEESLNLAYHGARAESSDFHINFERDLDPGAGQIELYPQEITRALLNMISNGFYAATRRASEAGDGFEPTLLAATRGLADRVEIRVRDNGMGIPPEVRDKMFNPFFTTKPAGEGTGLGLSMSHDIVVKQHGGTIDVETEPGRFTEFIIRLPRAMPT
jgi:two-component system, NtrC family, sensor kinase